MEDANSRRLNALSTEALEAYLEKLRYEKTDRKSWIAQPNNWISSLAIVVSLLGVMYQ